MISKLLWKLLMWLWVRQAKRYWSNEPSADVQFNTAGFQKAIKDTTGHMPGAVVEHWLEESGYRRKEGHAHWFNNSQARDAFFVGKGS